MSVGISGEVGLLTGYGRGHDVLADWHDGRVTELP